MSSNKRVVINLSTLAESHYLNLSPQDALISQHMIDNNLASSVSDEEARAEVAKLIQTGEKTIAIGDLCVMK